MRQPLVFLGYVALGLAVLQWALHGFEDSLNNTVFLLGSAVGAWAAASGLRQAGALTFAFGLVLLAVAFFVDGPGIHDWIAAGIALGASVAAWGELRDRPHLAALGFAAAGLVQLYWVWSNIQWTGLGGYTVGNLLFTLGAALAVTGHWRADVGPAPVRAAVPPQP